jgi:hypothetical protein
MRSPSALDITDVRSQLRLQPATSVVQSATSKAVLCDGEILDYGTQQTQEVVGERDEL